MERVLSSIVLAFVLALSAIAFHAPTTSAQEPGALVIAKTVCPPIGPGDEIDPAECVEPAVGVEFFAANPGTGNVAFGATGGDGRVSFPLDQFAISPDGATVEVGEILATNPYGEVAGYVVRCTRNGEPLAFNYVTGEVQPGGVTYGIQFTVFEGDQVSCEWLNSQATTPDPDPVEPVDPVDPVDPTPGDVDQTGGPVGQLPATGVGVAIGGSMNTAGYALMALSLVLAALAPFARPRATK